MISVFGSDIGEREIEAVSKCMRSQWLGFGKQVDLFEQQFMQRLGLPAFAMVDSGSNALYLALRLLNLPAGSEVILPSFTWVSCAQAVLLAGLKPVFCDVDLQSMNIRVEDVVSVLSPKTSAIMIVHYAGLPVDLDPILALGFPVIEDAAHAVHAKLGDRPCGSMGAVGIFSFDAVKNLTAGEGGGITAQDPAMIERAKRLRYCGIGKSGFDAASHGRAERWWEYEISEAFIKMLPTNLAASIASVQLERLEELQARRQTIWNIYDSELRSIPGLELPMQANPRDQHGLFTYCIRVKDRDKLAGQLLEQGIYTTLRYHPLHMNPIYQQTNRHLPNTEQLNCEALSIPLHPRLSDDDVARVVEGIHGFFLS